MIEFEKYNPATCDHKWPSGFSSLEFMSGGECTGAIIERNNQYVCMICGDIEVSGETRYTEGDKPKHQHHYEQNVNIHLAKFIAPIVRKAAHFNDCSIDEFLSEIRQEIEKNITRDLRLDSDKRLASHYPYKESILGELP